MKRSELKLYLVTDSGLCSPDRFLPAVREALQGGATMVQLREKDLSGRQFYERACALRKLTLEYNVPFIINDRVDIALACGADGVHLGQSDLPIPQARMLLGSDMLIGASTKTVDQALLAQEQGADYLGVGALYPTNTKVITQPTSKETLQAICQAVTLPIVAIGGIKLHNIQELAHCGMDGVAVVSGILSTPDIPATCREFRRLLRTIL